MRAAPSVAPMSTPIETLRAIQHPTRRRIIEHLYLLGPSQVGTLARDLGEQVGSISHHLRMLERVGVVGRAPELATDGRTSWWRILSTSYSWSVDDFDSPAQRIEAKAAQRANVDHELRKLSVWRRESDAAPEPWRRAAFSSDYSAMASPAELEDLGCRLHRTVQEWRAEVDGEAARDDAEREPVFLFMHAFRSRP